MKNLQKLHWGAKLQLNITMSSIKCNCSALKVKIISWRTKIAYAIVKFTYFENENIVVICFVLYHPANEVWGKAMFSQVFICPWGGGVGFPACITGQMTRAGLPSLLDAYPPMHTSLGADSPGCRSLPMGYYGIQSTSGWYASYCNAFLWSLKFVLQKCWYNRFSRFSSFSEQTI